MYFVWQSLKFYLKCIPNLLDGIELGRGRKKNPGRWGERPGWGYCRGGPEETRFCIGGFIPPRFVAAPLRRYS